MSSSTAKCCATLASALTSIVNATKANQSVIAQAGKNVPQINIK
ncbi:MAG: DUF3130 family protein [Clostridiales bacterium]|nr:DUF3130 family protein [Clostridiales bacterium]